MDLQPMACCRVSPRFSKHTDRECDTELAPELGHVAVLRSRGM